MCPLTPALQRCCFALLLAGGLASSLYAQPLPRPGGDSMQFEHLTTNKGLPSNLIINVFQDHRGYLWVATEGSGLLRYDGYEVKEYRGVEGDSTSLGGDWVSAIFESKDGTLWIGSGGLNRFDPASETFRRYSHVEDDATSLSHDAVSAIHESNDGVLWIGTRGGGMNRFDPAAGTFRSYRHQAGDSTSLSGNWVFAISPFKVGCFLARSGHFTSPGKS